MSKITLNNVTTFQNDTTAVNVVNTNNTTLTTAFDNTLSRDGTSPNQMNANLDMNSNRVLNLPQPIGGQEPLRLQDYNTLLSGGTITTGLTSVGLVMPADYSVAGSPRTTNGNITVTLANTPTGTGGFVRATSPTIATPTITAPVISTITNTGTLTLPTTTDTLVGRATTDTLTNKTFNSAGTGNVLQVSGVTVSRGQYPGVATNTLATAGNIGELITSNVLAASAISLTSTVNANVTSISLTAGNWDIWGTVFTKPTGTTTTGFVQAAITTTTASIPSDSSTSTSTSQIFMPATSGIGSTAGGGVILPVAPITLSLSTTTTVFLVTSVQFGVSTMGAYGNIQARRV